MKDFLDLKLHIFHQHAGTFQPPQGLQPRIDELEKVVANIAKECALRVEKYDPYHGSFPLLRDELSWNTNNHRGFGNYLVRRLEADLKRERPQASPGQFVTVTISSSDTSGARVESVSLEDPPEHGFEFADLSKVGLTQPLAFTEDPDKALARLLLPTLRSVHRLRLGLDPRTKKPPPDYVFRIELSNKYKIRWAGWWQQALKESQSESHVLQLAYDMLEEEYKR